MEAHASDEWPLGNRRSATPQHRSIEQRCAAARRFRASQMGSASSNGGLGSPAAATASWPAEDLAAAASVPWAVDTMANGFYSAFGAWPEGHIVVGADGTLRLRTEPEDGEGLVAGGPWHEQVEQVLVEDQGLEPRR
eukprot:SAG22_NODE_1689_length_3806_cov_7.093067_3_plen_137_part_00